MNKLLVVLPTHAGDVEQARNLVNWIGELSGKLDAPLLIAIDSTLKPDKYGSLQIDAKKVFSQVRTMSVPVQKQGWPAACDTMFLGVAKWVKDNYKTPWLWLEPDCVPLKPDWLADLAEAYQQQPMRYLGAIIEQTGQPGLPPKHLTGCSIYPNNAIDDFMAIPTVVNHSDPWDTAGGDKIVNAAQHTNLIQHFWGQKDKPPIFVEARATAAPENQVLLDFLKADAVLFHRSKDGSLIPLLRKQREKPVEAPQPVTEAVSAPVLFDSSPAVVPMNLPPVRNKGGRPRKNPAPISEPVGA